MEPDWYPLKFAPIYSEKIWGGRRLEKLFNRELPGTGPIGESWEISDSDEQNSIVSNGEFKGISLSELLKTHKAELLGEAFKNLLHFPLLIKFIDAEDLLSVQVHPDDAYCEKHDPEQYGKKEAWIILESRTGSRVTKGLKAGTSKEVLEKAIADNSVEELLETFTVDPGDIILNEPGDVHALGAGIVIYEVQQTSDATYRVYDYGRTGLNGKTRPLHIKQALDVINFGVEKAQKESTKPLSGYDGVNELLVETDKFILERLCIEQTALFPRSGDRFHVLTVLSGSGSIHYGGGVPRSLSYSAGESILLPAALGSIEFSPEIISSFAIASIDPKDAENLRT